MKKNRSRTVKKNAPCQKLTPGPHFLITIDFIQKMTPKGDPGPGGTNHDFHNFFALGPPGAPQERPRVPKVSPRERREDKSDPKSTQLQYKLIKQTSKKRTTESLFPCLCKLKGPPTPPATTHTTKQGAPTCDDPVPPATWILIPPTWIS